MYHCLEVVEILQCIFNVFRADHEADPRTLANLAMTCRTFREPALDALWWFIPSLDPLRGLMPDDLWERKDETSDGEQEQRVPRRTLKPSDFARWPVYTGRVRFISGQGSWLQLTLDDIQFLAIAQLYNVALFSNLERLQIIEPKLHDAHWEVPIGALLGSSIKWLCFWMDPSSSSFPKTCEEIRQACPSLELLEWGSSLFSDRWPSSESSSAFAELLKSLNYLQFLFCNHYVPFPEDALRRLAQLPNLKLLGTGNTVDEIFAAAESSKSSESPPFPKLRFLSAMIVNFDSAGLKLTQAITSNQFETFVLLGANGRSPPEQDLRTFFQTIVDMKWKDVSLIPNGSGPLPDSEVWTSPTYRVTSTTFEPLLTLHNLEVVEIELHMSFDLDDSILHAMAKAWPFLCTLKLGRHTWGKIEGGPKITLDGLIPLVEHCPRLEALRLCIDAATAPAAPATVTNTVLGELDLCDSTISEPMIVASFFSDLFPNLLKITVSSPDLSQWWMTTDDEELARKKWGEVNDLLSAARNAKT